MRRVKLIGATESNVQSIDFRTLISPNQILSSISSFAERYLFRSEELFPYANREMFPIPIGRYLSRCFSIRLKAMRLNAEFRKSSTFFICCPTNETESFEINTIVRRRGSGSVPFRAFMPYKSYSASLRCKLGSEQSERSSR